MSARTGYDGWAVITVDGLRFSGWTGDLDICYDTDRIAYIKSSMTIDNVEVLGEDGEPLLENRKNGKFVKPQQEQDADSVPEP